MPRVGRDPPMPEAPEPHTVEMHQPCPTKPTCSRTPGPDTQPPPHPTAHAAMCVPPAVPPGWAHLQLQHQVHAVLAEGADVVEDEGGDDVNAI